MDYVIIALSGKQYRVSEGDELVTDKIDQDSLKGDLLEVDSVLLTKAGEKVQVGQPFVKGAKVVLKQEKTQKGEKMRIFTFKAKSRYRRTLGFRPHQSVFTVQKITV